MSSGAAGGDAMCSGASRASTYSAVSVSAVLTVVVAVGADLSAGSHLSHVCLVGGAALAVGIVRTTLAGRHRVVFGLLSALVVAQPAVHATLAASGGLGSVAPAPHGGGHDALLAIASVAFAAAIAAAVGTAESVLLAAEAALSACWRSVLDLLVGRTVAADARVVPSSEPDHPRGRLWTRAEASRGPPVAASCA